MSRAQLLLSLCGVTVVEALSPLHGVMIGPDGDTVDARPFSAITGSASSTRTGASAEALRALDDLWSGSDTVSSAAYEEFFGSSSLDGHSFSAQLKGPRDDQRSQRRSRTVQSPALQIMGMFDSGTNLLGALLAKNIGMKAMLEVCPTAKKEGYHCLFWKHSPPQELERQLNKLQGEGQQVVSVSMIRRPLAHLAGWVKAPYDLSMCIKNTDWKHDEKASCTIKGESFAGPTGVWNSYVQKYDQLASIDADSYHKSIVVEYERLVLEPEDVVREITEALGMNLTAPFQTLEAPAKHHGSPHGREKAIQDITKMTYLQQAPFSKQGVRAAVCANLKDGSLRRHAIRAVPRDGRVDASSTYMADCM